MSRSQATTARSAEHNIDVEGHVFSPVAECVVADC